MCGQMVRSLLPRDKLTGTEAASASHLEGRAPPSLHVRIVLHTMHQLEMLTKMVFPVERALQITLLLARTVVVCLHVCIVGIEVLAKYTLIEAGRGLDSSGAEGTACPSFLVSCQ